ncbi:hypothetical protein GCM10020219_011100 [Nonomuraea dietziae]
MKPAYGGVLEPSQGGEDLQRFAPARTLLATVREHGLRLCGRGATGRCEVGGAAARGREEPEAESSEESGVESAVDGRPLAWRAWRTTAIL